MRDRPSTLGGRKNRRRLRLEDARCVYCHQGSPRTLTVDHIIPLALGGPNHRENAVSACAKCNNTKGAAVPRVFYGLDVLPAAPRQAFLRHLSECRRLPTPELVVVLASGREKRMSLARLP